MSAKDDEFEAFLAAVEGRLASYLRYVTGGSADAEDVFQDVCLAAHRNWRKVRSLERPAAWAVRVARNLLANRAKRRAVMARAPRREPAPAPAADAAAGEEELRREIAAALDELPEAERQAVAMKIWGELTWREIGAALGVSADTAARLFARGLRRLGGRLGSFAP